MYLDPVAGARRSIEEPQWCLACGGSGWLDHNPLRCPACGGSGWLYVAVEHESRKPLIRRIG